MHLLLIGGNGMLGRDLAAAAAARGHTVRVLDVPAFDITREESLAAMPDADAAINCAAYTRVDDAEKERELCRRINATGAGLLARACAKRNVPLLHVSTDYVFDGRKGAPYVEADPVAPLNYYGETKREGEELVLGAGGPALVVRTQSLFGVHGRNFVRAILGQVQKGVPSLRVVADQVSAPTYTRHLADALIDLAARPVASGIVHAAASGACSWWTFACAIVERVRPGLPVEQKTTAEMNYPALRPAQSVLDTSRLRQLIGRTLPSWQEGLDAYLAEEPLTAIVRGA